MRGLILNEDGYVTYPAKIFEPIKDYVRSLNWKLTNIECMGGRQTYVFPFENTMEDYWISGAELYAMVQAHPDLQWIWGILSGFNPDISADEVCDGNFVDISAEGVQPYWQTPLQPYNSKASIEIVAFDSTQTYVQCDDISVLKALCRAFPEAEDLEEWNLRMDEEKRRNELSKLKQMLREAESGDAYAMVAVGSFYYTGRCGAEQDYAKALYWYTKAAERGNVTAISNLGYCYYYGRSIPVDMKKAFEMYCKAALLGDMAARYKCGDMYLNGYYVEQDQRTAFCIYKAVQDDMGDDRDYPYADVCRRLGTCYHKAQGVKADLLHAWERLHRAAELFEQRLEHGENQFTPGVLRQCQDELSEVESAIADKGWERLKMVPTAKVPSPEVLFPGYQDGSDGNGFDLYANLHAEQILSFLERALVVNKGPCSIRITVPVEERDRLLLNKSHFDEWLTGEPEVHSDVKKELRRSIADGVTYTPRCHAKSYLLKSCSWEEQQSILEEYGQILAQDAASEVAFITCEDDVIVRCRYNAIYIETMNNKQYMHILDKMQVPRRRYLLQAKDTFDCKHQGYSQSLVQDGQDIYSFIRKYQTSMYLEKIGMQENMFE